MKLHKIIISLSLFVFSLSAILIWLINLAENNFSSMILSFLLGGLLGFSILNLWFLKDKKDKKETDTYPEERDYSFLFIAIFFILGFFLCFILTGFPWFVEIDELMHVRFPLVDDPQKSLAEGCENLSLSKSAYCMNINFKKFWFYNISNVGKFMTFEEVKRDGGVCSHAASLYIQAAEELGYYAKKESIIGDEEIRHAYAIISGREDNDTYAYCTLDQEYVECFALSS